MDALMATVRGNPVAWARFYHTARWQRLRKVQLTQHPLCKYCLTRGIVSEISVEQWRLAGGCRGAADAPAMAVVPPVAVRPRPARWVAAQPGRDAAGVVRTWRACRSKLPHEFPLRKSHPVGPQVLD